LLFTNTNASKSQVLAEFLVKWMPTPNEEVEEQSSLPRKEDPKHWVMYFDGSFSFQGAGPEVLLISPTGEHLKYVFQMDFKEGNATNNTIEYEGLLMGLHAAAALGIKCLIVRGDSQLIGRQVMKDCYYL
jgi:hypothetical protein